MQCQTFNNLNDKTPIHPIKHGKRYFTIEICLFLRTIDIIKYNILLIKVTIMLTGHRDTLHFDVIRRTV